MVNQRRIAGSRNGKYKYLFTPKNQLIDISIATADKESPFL